MKKCVLVFLLVVKGMSGYGQHSLKKDQIDSFNWGIIASARFRSPNPDELYLIDNEMVTRFQGRSFELQGYMVPIENARKHAKFMLSTLPIKQCFYCGKNGVPVMVMIEMDQAIPYSNSPVTVKGMLKLDKRNATVYPPITITGASAMP